MSDPILQSREEAAALLRLLGKPIAFQRPFVKIGGGLSAGVLLSQAFHWSNNEAAKARSGWFYKTHSQWEEETGMTRREQETARKHLRENGLLEERPGSVHGKRVTWYRVNLDALFTALIGLVESPDSPPTEADVKRECNAPASPGGTAQGMHENAPPDAPNRHSPMHDSATDNAPKRHSLLIPTENTTENTAEMTQENTHTPRGARGGAPPARVGVTAAGKSKFSKPELWRYANSNGLGGGWVTLAWRTGESDYEVEIFLRNGGQHAADQRQPGAARREHHEPAGPAERRGPPADRFKPATVIGSAI